MYDAEPSAEDASRFSEALRLIRGHTNQPIFEMWFQGLKFVSRTDETITIGTPNTFVFQWLDEPGSRETLRDGIRKAFGATLEPVLKVLPRASKTAGPAERADGSKAVEAKSPDAPVAAEDDPTGEPTETSDAPARAHPPGRVDTAELRTSTPRAAYTASSSTEVVAPRALDPTSSVCLNPTYRFDDFVVGPCNQMSHAASIAVAESPGRAYNPLFIHGGVGLGKTHLLQAVCYQLLDTPDVQPRILYLSCEDFVNQFIEAVEKRELDSFRYRYRHVDTLVIDDIHFLADKERTQEEFFHTFNTLYNSQKQIVLSADCSPAEIPTLEERLVSRFMWGLVARLDPPEYETRAAILRAKSRQRGVELPDDVIDFIATNVRSNIREIEGALTRLIVVANYSDQRKIKLPFAEAALRDTLCGPQRQVAIRDILETVCHHFDVRPSDLQSRKRTQAISRPRQICVLLARRLTDLTLVEIGGHLGGRDHSTILYAFEKMDREVRRKPDTRALIEGLIEKVQKKAVE